MNCVSFGTGTRAGAREEKTKGSIAARVADARIVDCIVDLFKAWDADCDGVVSRQELRRFMRFVTNDSISELMVDRLMEVADLNRNGVIELEEFVTWIFNPRTGLLSSDFQPSKIEAQTSPAAVDALREWFNIFDMNRNGTIEYEEFAVASMLLRREIAAEDINDDFQSLDRNRNRKIAWPEFLNEYSRLLDGIPRPLEEKIGMISSRRVALIQAAREAAFAGGDQKVLDADEFRELLKHKHGSIEDGFSAMDVMGTGSLNIVEFVNATEQLLDVRRGSGVVPLMVRSLFHELDPRATGIITVDQLKAVERGVHRQSGGSSATMGRGEQAVHEVLPKYGDVADMVRYVVRLLHKQSPSSVFRLVERGAKSVPSGEIDTQVRLKDVPAFRKPMTDDVLDVAPPEEFALDVAWQVKRRASTGSGGAFGVGSLHSHRVTPIEFEAMVTSCLTQVPTYREQVRRYGGKLGARIHLQGWTIKELFNCMDVDGNGQISLSEWETWLQEVIDQDSFAADHRSPSSASAARFTPVPPKADRRRLGKRPPRRRVPMAIGGADAWVDVTFRDAAPS